MSIRPIGWSSSMMMAWSAWGWTAAYAPFLDRTCKSRSTFRMLGSQSAACNWSYITCQTSWYTNWSSWGRAGRTYSGIANRISAAYCGQSSKADHETPHKKRDQVRGGKTPCNAMQKLSVRYGIMLLCGWLPPDGATMLGFIVWFICAPEVWAFGVAPP